MTGERGEKLGPCWTTGVSVVAAEARQAETQAAVRTTGRS